MARTRGKRYVQVVGTGVEPPALGAAELPVGSVYNNGTDDTDPAILLGYGTWERIPSGGWVLTL